MPSSRLGRVVPAAADGTSAQENTVGLVSPMLRSDALSVRSNDRGQHGLKLVGQSIVRLGPPLFRHSQNEIDNTNYG